MAACAASGAAFLALTGCGGGQPEDSYSGPPPASYDRGSASSPTLMGGAPAPARGNGSTLAGGPPDAVGMAPIPNPEDLTRAERVKYYGHKYDHLPEPKGAKAAGQPRYALITRRQADGTLEVSMRPIANPEDMSAAERRRVYGNRYAPRPQVKVSPRRPAAATPVAAPAAKVAKAAPAPKVAVAPKPVAAAPAPKVATPLAKAPTAAKPVAAPKLTPAEQLSAAVKPEAVKGAVLTVPEGLAKGEEAKVSLSLPANLFDVIKREAAKLGLGKAARKAEVSATLTGEGYEITPPGAQTKTLKAGEAATFDWNVKPGAGDKAPLKATVDGTLTGDRKAKTTFSLATLEQAVAPAVEAVKEKASGFKFPKLSLKSLAIPGMKPVDVPGVGSVESEKLVGAGLALVALLLVLAMARNASAGRARAERRRKFRTMQDNAAAEPAHETVSQPYVNPMIAAAGGAAAGAAVAHVAHAAHDDHGHDAHGHDDHGHHDAHAADHGHDAHGHDAHGHDDHGAHGDHHAPAHAVSHHPEPAAHDDHGHAAHDDHAAHGDAHAADHGHDAHGHDAHAPDGHGHDAHPTSHHPEPAAAHDEHGHGHDDHGHDDHAAHGDAQGHDDHGHDAHHRQPEHA